jgi:hypothetical protein
MKSINSIIKVVAAFSLTSALAVTTALAQGGVITVDELGKGSFNGTPLPSGLQADPFSGIVTLAYQLPFPGVPGDVLLFETAGSNLASDLLRFDGHGFLYFFSEIEPTDVPPFDPADVPQFPQPVPGLQTVNLLETGPEGNNGALYNPAGGLPGDNSFGATYNFVSDVPEPGTGLLTMLGGGLLLALRARRQPKRQ